MPNSDRFILNDEYSIVDMMCGTELSKDAAISLLNEFDEKVTELYITVKKLEASFNYKGE